MTVKSLVAYISKFIAIIRWINVSELSRHLDQRGYLIGDILVLEADGDIREAHYDKDKKAFICSSNGDAYEFIPMDPQPIKFAFKPNRK